MPGKLVLAAELGVNHKTVKAALALLEREGVLVNQGECKPRGIAVGKRGRRGEGVRGRGRALRIGILLHEEDNKRVDYIVEIRHRLLEAGHAPFFAKRTLTDLRMDVGKVAALAQGSAADAWVVVAGSSGVLQWFAAQPPPVFGLFGFITKAGIAGAGPDHAPAFAEVARTLTGLGHRRIALLGRPEHRVPSPGRAETLFLQTLQKEGIELSDDHFPLWDGSPEGYQRCLEELFRNSPPTALLIQEPELFAAAFRFLAGRGIRVPQDVSMVCADWDHTFAWQIPSVAHIRAESEPWVRRLVGWAAHMSLGKEDRRRLFSKAEFVNGGTVGLVRG
jgi:hypothetical protein